MKRILLVEYHNTLREALGAALNGQPDLEVSAQSASLAQGALPLPKVV
jgi:DNA-binding NarL/FixJ family response regulator